MKHHPKQSLTKGMGALIIFLFALASCSKSTESKEDMLQHVSFIEYNLEKESHRWTRSQSKEIAILITNSEELSPYVLCMHDSGTCPKDIDFSKYSLLLVQGACTNGISKISVDKFVKQPNGRYTLNLDIALTMSDYPEHWTIALLIDKVDKNTHFDLNVTTFFP